MYIRARFGSITRISKTAVMLGLLALVFSIVSVAAPVAAAPLSTVTSTLASPHTTLSSGGRFSDSADINVIGSGTATGSVQFYFCGPTPSATPCAISSGNKAGGAQPLAGGVALSDAEFPTATGFYCWSAVYTSNSDSFTGSQSTSTTNECVQVIPAATSTTTVITTVTSPTTTTVTVPSTTTSTTITTITVTSPSTTTSTATSTQTSTETATSTSTLVNATCFDPEVTVTKTVIVSTTITDTQTSTATSTVTGTVTSTITSVTTITATSVVPTTITTTIVSATTICPTTTSSSSSAQTVPEFPLSGTSFLVFMVAALSIVLLLRKRLGTSKLQVPAA